MRIGPDLSARVVCLTLGAALAMGVSLLYAGDEEPSGKPPAPASNEPDGLDELDAAELPPKAKAESSPAIKEPSGPNLLDPTPAKKLKPPSADKPDQSGAARSPAADNSTPGEAKPDPKRESPAAAGSGAAVPSGDAMVLHAHSLTTTAKTVADYTKILGTCQQGIRLGLSPETDAYARRLMSWAYNRRGELLAEQGHDTVALADFEAAVYNDKTRWRAYHNRGVSYAMMGRHKEAIADFNRTLELNATYANAYFNRGEVRYELGEFDEALQDYSRAIQLESDDPMFYNSRGHAYYRMGKFREAAYDYTVAVRLNPQYAAALTNRGDLYTDLGFYEKAVADYQKAVRYDPGFVRAYLSAAWLMATCPDEKFRSVEGALEAISKAEQNESQNDFRYLDTLAAVHANAGNYAEAQRVLKRAVELAPPDTADVLTARLDLYKQQKAFRIAPRPVAAIAQQPRAGGAQQSNFEEPAGPRSVQKQKTPTPAQRKPPLRVPRY